MPTWPATLPQSPEREGYTERPGNAVIRAAVDGPQLTRRRYTAVPKGYTANFFLTSAELDTFQTFYETDLRGGALSYDWRERGIAANPVRQFLIVEEPTWTYLGGIYWRLTLQLIRLP